MLNRDEILREITLRICSGLEIKETLRNIAVVKGISVFRRNPFLVKGCKIELFPQ